MIGPRPPLQPCGLAGVCLEMQGSPRASHHETQNQNHRLTIGYSRQTNIDRSLNSRKSHANHHLPNMLTQKHKASAAEAFTMPDLDASNSETESESENEGLERYPGPPSPRSSARKYREKIAELQSTTPKKRQIGGGGKMLVGQDMENPFDRLNEAKGSKKRVDGGDKEENKGRMSKVGLGGVVIDAAPFAESKLAHQVENGYKAWQIRRATRSQSKAKTSNQLWPLSNMGHFATLPGELRNRIYRYSLLTSSCSEPFLITMQHGTCSLGPCLHAKLPTAVPGLLSSCRQVRGEAMPIFCGENIFKFDAKTVRDRCTANWLRALGHYGGLIPRILLEIIVWEPEERNSTKMIGRAYELTLHCPANAPASSVAGVRVGLVEKEDAFVLRIGPQIWAKEMEMCQKLLKHVERLNERTGTEVAEKLMLEFLWSDWMAELVYRCKK